MFGQPAPRGLCHAHRALAQSGLQTVDQTGKRALISRRPLALQPGLDQDNRLGHGRRQHQGINAKAKVQMLQPLVFK